MFIYQQSTGRLSSDRVDDGHYFAQGYSGQGTGKNNPLVQGVHNVGPIPQGMWGILGPPVDTATHGPYVLHLYAKSGTEAFGRSGFLIHGDSLEHPGQASQGCVILPRTVREHIWNSEDRDWKVIP